MDGAPHCLADLGDSGNNLTAMKGYGWLDKTPFRILEMILLSQTISPRSREVGQQ